MALEVLYGTESINNVRLMCDEDRPTNEDGSVNWVAFDSMRAVYPICIDYSKNMISFKVQDGSIKENGKNGCQVEDIIATAKKIIDELNKKFPCRENAMMITKLDEALMWSKKRTEDRINRNVEGKSEE